MHCCVSHNKNCKLKVISNYNDYKKVSSDRKFIYSNCKLMFCKKCNFFRKKINPTYKKNIAKIYNSYDELFADEAVDQIKIFKPKKYKTEITLEHLEKKMSILKYNNYLDYGCGFGAVSNALIKRKIPKEKIYCYDTINVLNKKIDQKINTFYKKKTEILKKFDVIYLNHVFEHFVAPEKELLFINNIINKNGLIIIQIPNLAKYPYDIFIFDHIYHFTRKSIIKFFSNFNLDLVYLNTKLFPEDIIAVLKKTEKKKIKYSLNSKSSIEFNSFFNKINNFLFEMKRFKTVFFYGASLITLFYCNNLKNKKIIIFDDNKNIKANFNKDIKIYHSSQIKNYKNIIIFSSIGKKIQKKLYILSNNIRIKNLLTLY